MRIAIVIVLAFIIGAGTALAVGGGTTHVDPYIRDLGENWLAARGLSNDASSRVGLWVAMIECRDLSARERDRILVTYPDPNSDPTVRAELAALTALVTIFDETGCRLATGAP